MDVQCVWAAKLLSAEGFVFGGGDVAERAPLQACHGIEDDGRGKFAAAQDVISHRNLVCSEELRYALVHAFVAAADQNDAFHLRQFCREILVELASFITVPEAHVAEQRVGPTAEPEAGPSGPIRPLIRIASSPERPADAFAAVAYRDHWFWIDDRDMPSKRLFSFLFFIFTLVETGAKETPTVITIPAG